jgi:hypothetical protein
MTPCKRCGGEVVQKPILRLVLVGAILLACAGFMAPWFIMWLPAAILVLTGIYLLIWAIAGRGR